MDSAPTRQLDRILIVAKDEELGEALVETLEAAGGYLTSHVTSFEEALGEILLGDFALIITEAELPDLSGMDLLAVVGGLRPHIAVMLIDDDLSARSVMAAFRLGAIDYLSKPVNLEFVLMQVQRTLDKRAMVALPPPEQTRQSGLRNRERRLNPDTRPAALVLGHAQFQRIGVELGRLRMQVKAHFVGLVDIAGNMISAAGMLEDCDLILLTKALSIDQGATTSLASILEENRFHSSYFEGERSGVYIVEFGHPYLVSMAVTCPVEVKPGMVWLYCKRTAAAIEQILSTIEAPRVVPSIG